MSEQPLTLLRPYVDDEAKANLHSYINTRDRGSPPVFVGRDEIFQRLAKDVEECRSNTRGSTSFTRVIQGAPGAGKTSLIVELKERLGSGIGESKTNHGAVVVVSISGGVFFREAFVASKFIEAYIGKDFDVQIEKSSSTSAQAGAAGFGASHGRTTKKRSLEQQIQSAGEIWKSVIDNTSINKDETVFLLLIDEAQSIRGVASESGENHIVINLHEGADAVRGLKVVPVFTGLTDTVSVLADRGVSRLSRDSVIRLGSLSEEETEELVNRWMRHEAFGFDNLFSDADIARVSKMIAVSSEGWPRHVNGYLSELARSVLQQGMSNDLKIDLDDVLDRGHDDRLAYYQQRLRITNLGRYAGVIRDAAQQSEDGVIDLATLDMLVDEKYPSMRLDAEALRAKAIHAGILEYASNDDEERFKFPIPSFFTYMHLGRNATKFKAKMREQMDGESHRWSKPNGLTQ